VTVQPQHGNLSAFLARPPDRSDNFSSGNNPEAVAIAAELREAVRTASANSARTLQVHLGPSEIGEPCHRQVVGKLAGVAATNHVSDPWPAYIGTAVHAKLADDLEKARPGQWYAERRVEPIPGHSGTADLYDAVRQGVEDHKVLGTTTHAKIRQHGPGRRYFIQLLLYGRGYARLGLPVRYVALLAWARTGGLSGLYVWHHTLTPEDDALLDYVEGIELPWRKAMAAEVSVGRLTLLDIPIGDQKPDCYFCPFYRPEAVRNPSVAGCPGP
jgi:hypothetical protein